MADIHRLVGLAGIAVAALAAIWSIGLLVIRRNADRPYLVWLGVVVAVVLLAALFGGLLLITGSAPSDPLHLVYGFVALIAIPIGVGFAAGRPARRQSVVMLIAVLVELGVTVRLLMTG